jgi:hypothetical protein
MLLLTFLAATALGTDDGKIMAEDSWTGLTILEVGGSPAGAPQFLRVAAGDLDGDGRADEAYLKFLCADGSVTQAKLRGVQSPRDSASGMASGRRQHAPVKFVKEWGAATPQLRAMKVGYDVKKMEGARADAEGWWDVSLSSADGLCPAAETAAAQVVKSKSNITNN